jgi:DNA-binding transcriptional LysR family regulator
MMHLFTMKAFLTVAELKSFSRAAEHLHMSQPALSLQVKKLESFYRTKLFNRKGRWLEMTDAGKAAKLYAERLLEVLKQSEISLHELAEKRPRRIRVGAGSTSGPYVMATLLGTFKRLHPQSEIIMKIGTFDELRVLMAEDQIELCLSRLPRPVEPYGLKCERYREIVMKAVVSTIHPLAKKRAVSLDRFAEEPFILQPQGRLNRNVVETYFAKRKLSIKVQMEFDSIEAIKAAVKENFGVSVVNEYSLLSDVTARALKVLPVRDLDIRLPLYIIYRDEKKLSVAGQEFMEFLRNNKN